MKERKRKVFEDKEEGGLYFGERVVNRGRCLDSDPSDHCQ